MEHSVFDQMREFPQGIVHPHSPSRFSLRFNPGYCIKTTICPFLSAGLGPAIASDCLSFYPYKPYFSHPNVDSFDTLSYSFQACRSSAKRWFQNGHRRFAESHSLPSRPMPKRLYTFVPRPGLVLGGGIIAHVGQWGPACETLRYPSRHAIEFTKGFYLWRQDPIEFPKPALHPERQAASAPSRKRIPSIRLDTPRVRMKRWTWWPNRIRCFKGGNGPRFRSMHYQRNRSCVVTKKLNHRF